MYLISYCGLVAPHLLTYREVGTHFKVGWANSPPPPPPPILCQMLSLNLVSRGHTPRKVRRGLVSCLYHSRSNIDKAVIARDILTVYFLWNVCGLIRNVGGFIKLRCKTSRLAICFQELYA